MQKRLAVIFLFILNAIYAQNIVVDDQRTAQNLVEDVLLNNTGCASVFNFSVNGGNFPSGENSYGYFDASGTIFPFQEGLILSNGKINETPGPNSDIISGEAGGWQGFDTTIANILNEPNTFNATSLEFDFVPLVDFMSFEYIFVSEEYTNQFMCTFSDVFGFLIKKANAPDSDYVNIALIPNTNTPVKVTTVHPLGQCSAINEEFFNGFNPFNYPIDFNGQTVPLLAQSQVIPGTTYHIKLIIADDGDEIYDSAVFLRAGSFNIGTFLGEDRTILSQNPVCGQEEIILDAGIAVTYQWYKDDIPLSGEINQLLTVTPTSGNGKYSVDVDLGGGCLSNGDIEIEFFPFPDTQDTTLISCRDEETNKATFDLTEPTFIDTITRGDTNLIIEGFYVTMLDAQNEPPTNPINNLPNYETHINQPIFAKIVNVAGCASFATITLDILEFPEIIDDETVYYCLDKFPEMINISAGLVDDSIPFNFIYNWLPNAETTSSININEIGDYTVKIINSDGCSVTRKISVLPSETPTFENVLITDTKYRDRVSIIVEVSGQGDYQYGIDIESSEINNDESYQDENIFDNILYGTHIIYIRDKNGCGLIQKEVTFLEYSKFITPNNDGLYDNWNIDNINAISHNFNTISNIIIFDRLGKVMANINPKGLGWDGNYKGKPAPPSDYWFRLELVDFNGRAITKKGHFVLKRIK